MSAGLYPMSTICEWLGKRPDEMTRVIEEDGLPVINVPTKQKTVHKCSLLGLHRWVTKRSVNAAITVDDLEHELDCAAAKVAARLRAKAARRQAKEGQAA